MNNRNSRPASLSLGHWLRVAFLLALIAWLTWFGKFHEPERKAVRNHGLLGWIAPTPQGLSLLMVLPDDANDSNAVRTGHRIWLRPPPSPRRLETELFAYFRGPSLTVVADSLSAQALEELVEMVDSGGVVHLVGVAGWDSAQLHRRFPHHSWEVDSLEGRVLFWEDPHGGEDARTGLEVCNPLADCGALSVRVGGYRVVAGWGPPPVYADSSSLWIWLAPALDSGDLGPLAAAALGMGVAGVVGSDSTRLFLHGPEAGAVFVEDESHKRLLFRQITLRNWGLGMPKSPAGNAP